MWYKRSPEHQTSAAVGSGSKELPSSPFPGDWSWVIAAAWRGDSWTCPPTPQGEPEARNKVIRDTGL